MYPSQHSAPDRARNVPRAAGLGCAALILFAFADAALAQQRLLPPEVRAAANAISAEQLARDLEFLSADALLGRNTPSPGFDTAAAYIARRLQAAGLKPLGDDGTWFQHYDLRDERVDTASAALEVGGRRFAFGEDFVMRSFAGGLQGTYPVIFVGHGWTVPDHDIDPFRGMDVRGALVLAHGPTPAPALEGVRQVGRLTVGARQIFAEAHRRGAAGIIFMAAPSALNGWASLARANITRLELDPIVASAYAALPITSVLVKPHVVEALLAGEAPGTRARVARGDTVMRPEPLRLQRQVTIHVPVAQSIVHRPYNIVALLEGSDPLLRDEYVTVEAHLDGAVGAVPQNGDSIYNSADDNATGSAGALAIAEQMMRAPRPKRSIIFIWDSGEERGLWGTRHFVHDPPVPLDRIVAHFNIDMIGATRAPGSADSASAEVTGPNEVYLTGPAVLSAQIDSVLERVNAEYLGMTLNRTFDRPDHEFFYPRTDAGPFLERGILTIGFFTGIHDRYHAPRDEAQYLDPDKMAAVTRTAFASIWAVASMAERPRIDRGIPPAVPRY